MNKKYILVIAHVLFVIQSQGQQFNKTTITGGEAVHISTRPFQVTLQDNNVNGRNICGGSIINDSWILTAAHCVTSAHYPVENMVVAIGISEQNEVGIEGQLLDIKNWYAHPNYDADRTSPTFLTNDIALIELEQPIVFGKNAQPVRMATPDMEQYFTPDMLGYASGWGQTEFEPFPNHLMGVEIPFMSNDEAESQLEISAPEYASLVDNTMIATQSIGLERIGPCHGDSGGPLTFHNNEGINHLVGAVSWGAGGCTGGANSPTLYAKVPLHYENWILPLVCQENMVINDSIYEDALFQAITNLEVDAYVDGAAQTELYGGNEVYLAPGFEFFAEEEGNLAVLTGGACASQAVQALIASVTYSQETTDQSVDLFFHHQIEQASSNTEDLSLLLAPNPALNQVEVSFTSNATLKGIQMVTLSGQVLMSSNIVNEKSITIPLQDILAGTYFVIATDHLGNNYKEILSVVK